MSTTPATLPDALAEIARLREALARVTAERDALRAELGEVRAAARLAAQAADLLAARLEGRGRAGG